VKTWSPDHNGPPLPRTGGGIPSRPPGNPPGAKAGESIDLAIPPVRYFMMSDATSWVTKAMLRRQGDRGGVFSRSRIAALSRKESSDSFGNCCFANKRIGRFDGSGRLKLWEWDGWAA